MKQHELNTMYIINALHNVTMLHTLTLLIKRIVDKIENCHNVSPLKLFQTCMNFFLEWNIKDDIL